ncbi:LacI family DNA-binding transcriptional regulator [Varibaculum massiliense]|uniref:LacI family DNA-binding transcriptional regulator n=1 Tax=Varibaculum massiliense TaxID=1852372 RepID=UPI0008D903C8|nr:LacI family DNA-binding transcriptional regulator [Varibaculum massiliense]
MVTIKDVAKAANVSPMTASRVVNRTGNVNSNMRSRVLRAVEQLGYVPNLSASKLRASKGKHWTIGLILRDVSNPFSAELHRSIEKSLRDSGSLTLTASNDDNREYAREVVMIMRAHQIDGLIIAPPPGSQSYLTAAAETGLPIVIVDRPSESGLIPCVISDNYEGMRQATRHLASFGHRRIAYLGDELSAPMIARRDGFFAGLDEMRIARDETIVFLDQVNPNQARNTVSSLLKSPNPPSAFLGSRNRINVAILQALREHGQEKQIAMIGFDDVELAAELSPGMTAIAQNPALIGQIATGILIEMIENNHIDGQTVVVSTRLIPRGSGEISCSSQYVD